jgi:chromosome segregation ATPase
MSDLPKFLAAQITLTDTALRALGEFRGALDSLASRAGEVEALKAELPKLKAQLAELKAQIEVGHREVAEMKEAHDKASAELSEPFTKMHELQTMLKSV